MHASLLAIVMVLTAGVRLWWGTPKADQPWQHRWQTALLRFSLPPLLLLCMAIAVFSMGTRGTMLGLPVGWIGYLLALSFILFAAVWGAKLWAQAQRSQQHLQRHSPIVYQDQLLRLIDSPLLFAAQIGWWRSELVVSQGLLDRLNTEQIAAVLTHEQAHAHYRDTFWFLGLGWLRQITAWLPQTEALWQELLLLRELRADRWAADRVDPLLLAEALLIVVRSPLDLSPDITCTASFGNNPVNRLEERIEALLADPTPAPPPSRWWLGLAMAFLPLLTLLLHH